MLYNTVKIDKYNISVYCIMNYDEVPPRVR